MKERALRFNPMSDAWPMVILDLGVVVALTSVARAIGGLATTTASGWVVFVVTSTALVMVFVAIPLRSLLRAQRKESTTTETALRVQNERQQFDARLGRALDMADSESVALSTAARALSLCTDDLQGSILLADNSDAHLQTVVTTDGRSSDGTCEVATPRGCPTVRIGQTLEFSSSDQFNCCPHLSERSRRSLAALCVPVSVVGRATGVVHVVRDDRPFDAVERSRIETVAHQSGQRVGMLRATAQTQLQVTTPAIERCGCFHALCATPSAPATSC